MSGDAPIVDASEAVYDSSMADTVTTEFALSRLPLFAVALLAGCSSAPPVGTETIIYEKSVAFCFGCKMYAFKLHADGKGEFSGNSNTAIPDGAFRATPAQVRAFAEQLAPYRPNGTRSLQRLGSQCDTLSHDGVTYVIRWKGEGGKPARLTVYSGCDKEKNKAMLAAVSTAPDVLPLEPLLGPADYIPPPELWPEPCVHPETCKPPIPIK
jgi:hypothetical protein